MLDWSQSHVDVAHTCYSDAAGLLYETRIATTMGWRDVEALKVGDCVLTFDNGFQPIKSLRRISFELTSKVERSIYQPLKIEDGLLGDVRSACVMPGQGIMVESDFAESYRGDPFAVIRPFAMQDYGVAHPINAGERLEVVMLEFEADEVIYSECGLMFHIPASFNLLDGNTQSETYKVLNEHETIVVMAELYNAHVGF